MKRNKPPVKKISQQIKDRASTEKRGRLTTQRDAVFVSTGNTLLDLAISGNINREGGLKGGIIVEVFGPESSGKTVLLCEIAGQIQREGGDMLYKDPEARLDRDFAKLFGVNIPDANYSTPKTVTELFGSIKDWKSSPEKKGAINAIFVDSLAALSTTMEMGEKGDKTGMRRAKEFSAELRKISVVVRDNNYLIVCSNQIREVVGATAFQEKTSTPGGKGIPFYSSVRIKFNKPSKIKKVKKIRDVKQTKVIGDLVKVVVYKNSLDVKWREANIYMMYNYGVDDIRGNLEYIKENTKAETYNVNGENFSTINSAIKYIEDNNAEQILKDTVIDLWNEIENAFYDERKPKY